MKSVRNIKKKRSSIRRRNVSTQTEYSDDIRSVTLLNIIDLLNGADDRIHISKGQNQMLADEFEKCSAINLIESIRVHDFICSPPDVIPYEVKDTFGKVGLYYTCTEINGTGFGGLRNLPYNQLNIVMNTYIKAAKEIKIFCNKINEKPLIIIGNSGREGAIRINSKYQSKSNSKMIWEKAFIADKFAEIFSTYNKPCYVNSFDKFSQMYYKKVDFYNNLFINKALSVDELKSNIDKAYDLVASFMKNYANKPLVLLGYTRDIVECCRIKNNRSYLFGRPINGFINDRCIYNLIKSQNKSLDLKKTCLMNITFEEGVNKYSATLSRNEFHLSNEIKKLPQIAKNRGFNFDLCGLDKINYYQNFENKKNIFNLNENELFNQRLTYYRGVTEEEGINGIIKAYRDFKQIDLIPLFKPSGTGQSKGIIARKVNESENEFKIRFNENLKELEMLYGKGAGYPFMVMPLLNLAKIEPGLIYDLRFVVYRKINDLNNKSTIHCIPLIIKKVLNVKKENEFSPTNITESSLKTGRPGADFIIPLCSEKGMEITKLNKDQLKSMCLYFSAYISWLLSNKYSKLV